MIMIIVFVEILAINHKQCHHMLEQIHRHVCQCIQTREMVDQFMGAVEIASIRTDGVHVIGKFEIGFLPTFERILTIFLSIDLVIISEIISITSTTDHNMAIIIEIVIVIETIKEG